MKHQKDHLDRRNVDLTGLEPYWRACFSFCKSFTCILPYQRFLFTPLYQF